MSVAEASSEANSFEWIRSLEAFVASAYCKAALARNPSYLVRGIVLAIDDHPARWAETFTALQSILRVARDPAEKYFAWALIDAVVKNSTIEPLKREIASQFPNLILHELPITGGPSGPPGVLFLYYDLMRSWSALRTFPADTMAHCEEFLKYKLLREEESDVPHSKDNQAAKLNPSKIRSVILAISGKQDQDSGGGVSASSAPQRTVGKFLVDLYDEQRVETCCLQCGAYFTTKEARDTHHRLHYVFRGADGAFMRLKYPQAAQFVEHSARPLATGRFIRLAVAAGDAERLGFGVKINSELTTSVAKSGKRAEVQVSDLSIKYICAVCHQELVPQLGALPQGGQGWVLPSAVPMQTSTGTEYAHVACVATL